MDKNPLALNNNMAAFVEKGRWLRLAGAAGVAAVGIVTLVRYYQQSCGL